MDIKARFIQVLEEDIAEWEKAAARCDFLVEYVVAGEKDQMAAQAEHYRARAKTLRDFVKLVKEQV